MPAEDAPISCADIALARGIFGALGDVPVQPHEMPRLAARRIQNASDVAQRLLDLADEVVRLELRFSVPADWPAMKSCRPVAITPLA